jgi:hypothetical protein
MYTKDTFRRAKYENGIEYNRFGEDVKARTAEFIADMEAKAKKVAKALDWTMEPSKENTREGTFILLPGDGSKIWFSALGYPDGSKLSISASYPRNKNGEHVTARDEKNNSIPAPSISMTANKTADQIVTAIKNRFLPGHTTYMAALNKAIKQWDDYNDGKKATSDAIKRLLGTDPRREGTEFYLPGSWPGYGDIRVSSASSIDFNLKGIPLDLAAALIKVIKGMYP